MMASTSTADIKVWHEGDRCLAPSPRDGTLLREGTIQKLPSTSHGEDMALVKFTDQHDEEEEAVFPVCKLQRPDTNQSSTGVVSAQEKPLFLCSQIPPGPSEPLVLSQSGVAVPYTINRYLRYYQKEGIQFIYDNYAQSRGCILGDDMGLGKTIQVIGFLAAVLGKTGTWEDIENNRPQFLRTQIPTQRSKPRKVFLIVAPLSVLYNWKEELETWGYFLTVVVHGLRKEEELARIQRGRSEIALTTYETLRLCLEQFNSIDWSAVIVDEAHKIKNPNSQITGAMKELRCLVRVGLTGTILQNNLDELWCVMDWAIPRCLGSLGNFKNMFSDPIELGQKHSVTKRALATGRRAVQALAGKLSQWFLRRTKALIREQLPKKDDRVVYCSLTSFQQTVYQAVLDTEDVTLLLRSSEKCDCQSGRSRRKCCYKVNARGVRVTDLYFSYLAILRKVANHVALLQSKWNTSKKQEQYVNEICEKVFQKFPDFTEKCKQAAFEAMSDPMYSGKMKVLQRLLKHYVQRKDKVLLFSLSTKLLDVLESYCMADGLEYSRLDGNTKPRERLKIVKEFNSCPDINLCLVSTMAGGLGLNFVGANIVVLFDPTWNPANDLQAIDRAYRIGQCRDVTVFRLISLGTVEEVIYLRQVYKQQLQSSVVGKESARRYFDAVQGSDDQKGELFGIQNLFRLQTQGTCLTRRILEREGRVEVGVMTASTHTGEEEERKSESEAGEVSARDHCELGNGGAIGSVGASRIPRGTTRGVLDFSSEEEEGGREGRSKVEKGNTTLPGRLSLLQHGFSRLLQRSGVRAGSGSESGEHSQSEGGRSDSEEDSDEDTSAMAPKGLSTAGSGGPQTPTLAPKGGNHLDAAPLKNDWDISSGSEREEERNGGRGDGQRGRDHDPVTLSGESDDMARKIQNLKQGIRRKRRVEEDSDDDSPPSGGGKRPNTKTPVSRMHQVVFDSESEDIDIDIEELIRPCAQTHVLKRPPAHLRRREMGRDGGSKRETSNRPVDQSRRTRQAEDIETFTSSDENHTPVVRVRSVTVPQNLNHGPDPQTDQHGAGAFTGLKNPKANQTVPSAKGPSCGTIDNVLGGVREVVYTHSNQHVVGGSKAEERISRVALRHVFERRKFSQLPANELRDTQETQPEHTPPFRTSHNDVGWVGAAHRPSVDHPVTHTIRSVHHPTQHTTVIIGETPGTIRRQQLEEMACVFGSGSLRQFAEEVLRSTSAQRLAQLRQYYTDQGPEVASIIRENFAEPHTAQPKVDRTASKPSSSSTTKHRPSSKRNQRVALEPQAEPRTPHRSLPEPQRDVPSSEEQRVRNARGEKKKSGNSRISRAAQYSSSDLDNSRSSPLGPGASGAQPVSSSSSSALSHPQAKPTASPQRGRSSLLSSPRKSEAVGRQRYRAQPSSPPSQQVLLTELLGDTSILDDLLRPRSKASSEPQRGFPKTPTSRAVFIPTSHSATPASCHPTTPPKPPSTPHPRPLTKSIPGPSSTTTPPSRSVTTPLTHPITPLFSLAPERSKNSHRDFWDILEEGNEERINKLTDPSEVERVCESASIRARGGTGGGEEKGNTSLWKRNDKFLWKK
ncbi:DNA excision repair protein ERCC-6-like 2 [Salmo trutta]|uniref:Excision repair cross-complementation group 6-like 2 n=1 Tax=Salmo trutta TaxID=8032 RepID=A0A673WNG6_SALTR|nr:DNA excision repair protein ERCC-6-like 2 [Salmo trutta]